MHTQLLSLEGCPNGQGTLAQLHNILSKEGLADPTQLTEVKTQEDAERLSFAGSPTVRVNGRDVDPQPPCGPGGLSCRVDWDAGRPRGAPSDSWLRSALLAARSVREQKPSLP